MKIETHRKLIFYFAGIVFLIILLSMSCMVCIAFLMYMNGVLPTNEHDASPLGPIIVLLILSLVIGAVVSLFVGSKIIKPVTDLTEVSKRVAEGDFDVKLSETGSIEEIREMSRNFNTMVDELSGIETLRNDFIVNVSHEFKTPIAAIEGYATLLQSEDLTDSERDEYTKMIIEGSRQLSKLSGNILNLSKLESQEIVMNKKDFRLDEQIRQAILLFEKDWSAKDLNMEIDLSNIGYHGDEGLLLQVWINLIGNAVKFTDAGGTISIQSYMQGSSAVVEITDSGCGMDESTIKKIFDKFYQGDTTRKSEGNGLGLTLAKRIIDLCGGDIKVESQPGSGSTFKISLPLS